MILRWGKGEFKKQKRTPVSVMHRPKKFQGARRFLLQLRRKKGVTRPYSKRDWRTIAKLLEEGKPRNPLKEEDLMAVEKKSLYPQGFAS